MGEDTDDHYVAELVALLRERPPNALIVEALVYLYGAVAHLHAGKAAESQERLLKAFPRIEALFDMVYGGPGANDESNR